MAEKDNKIGAVMVLGGGIGGMQAAIDLADSGFKVYLVEKSPFIGGRMAQLDKTFPTNDCAMCTISPRLVGAGRHLNIEILPSSDIVRVDGEAGNFKITLRQRQSFVDLAKCTACGDCKKVCPVEVGSEFDMGIGNRNAVYKSYPQAVPNGYVIDKKGFSACKVTCPAGISVQGYIALIAQKKYREALEMIMRDNPLPGVCSRMCHHPCESECRRSKVDSPISIRSLRRFLVDKVYGSEDFVPSQASEIKYKEKVAVIGAGPAGLSCAYYLRGMGYRVTIFETLPVRGGMLAVGIPEYRVPKKSLDEEIGNIEKTGVEIKLNSMLGRDFTLDDLRKDYQAVFLAVGTQKAQRLNIPGNDAEGVLWGVDFLRDVRLGKEARIGRKVLVIGGGNVAMDVARTALRLGAKDVSLACLESRDEMPAHPWETEEGEEEGIKFFCSVGPKEIVVENNKVKGLVTLRVKEVFDVERRFNPSFFAETESLIEADTVIVSIGQASDLSFIDSNSAINVSRRGTIEVNPLTQETGIKGIFAGGDAVRGPASAIEAIADGKKAALAIHNTFRGIEISQAMEKTIGEPDLEKRIPKKERAKPLQLSVNERIGNFKEIEKAYTEEQALEEALRCLNCSICSDCRLCEAACEPKAISHEQDFDRVIDLQVGSVILAPGFDLFDPDLKGEFGHNRFPNVLSSLEFERILSASGPYLGKIVRPSDKQEPKRIAWIQCVGSRDSERDYCSSVCCMYATKQAILVKEHIPDVECQIFFIDLRAHGKGFDDYCERAEKNGVIYTRCRPSSVKEIPATKNLGVQYQEETGKILNKEFDLVILSCGIVPRKDVKELSDKFGIELDKFNFCGSSKWQPLETNRKGIYACGPFLEPKDIPETVIQASGAASKSIELLAEERNTLVKAKEYPPETDVSKEEPRIGVFVCRCGTNIGGVIDVPSVVDYVKKLPSVVYAEENLYTCGADTIERIKQKIKEENLNRVVVTSCTPRTHEPLFQEVLKEAGLNPFLFEMANIRDQCAWVHMHETDKALKKAKSLAKMAVSRARFINPLYKLSLELKKEALVIGGGVSGMVTSMSLANQGFKVTLVEKEGELGGNLKNIKYTVEGENPEKFLGELIKKAEGNKNISIFLNSQVESFSGFIGNFKAKINSYGNGGEKDIDCGVVVVATGGAEYKGSEFEYGKDERVITQLELENKLYSSDDKIKNAKEIVMIQCVGSRNKERPYCSRVCCTEAIKNALKIKEINPDARITILYRDIRTYGFKEGYYTKAREKGILFIRYEKEKPPVVDSVKHSAFSVKVFDPVMREEIELNSEILVLSMATIPHPDNEKLAPLLKVPLTKENFFLEAHMKLRPVDFASEGIFLCGISQYPKFIEESIAQAEAVASRANTILSKNELSVGGSVAVVNDDLCATCLTCVRTCPYHVPRILDRAAHIEVAQCQGCGICASECPNKAIQLLHYTDEQVVAKVESFEVEEENGLISNAKAQSSNEIPSSNG
ncbi:MAG: hypothetical protein A3H37_10100 [Candidatus Schekmanbacteria bacterium RIFCSPLOWO2_02_FULL_38_14]|nr:MAG: hypothetical protein A3H37_10100 [Candidatus Schekmanbacteria bacterium RIFCSPLOWO2_02_FULL_38_14]